MGYLEEAPVLGFLVRLESPSVSVRKRHRMYLTACLGGEEQLNELLRKVG